MIVYYLVERAKELPDVPIAPAPDNMEIQGRKIPLQRNEFRMKLIDPDKRVYIYDVNVKVEYRV